MAFNLYIGANIIWIIIPIPFERFPRFSLAAEALVRVWFEIVVCIFPTLNQAHISNLEGPIGPSGDPTGCLPLHQLAAEALVRVWFENVLCICPTLKQAHSSNLEGPIGPAGDPTGCFAPFAKRERGEGRIGREKKKETDREEDRERDRFA